MADGTLRFNGEEHVVLGGTDAADRIHSSEGDDTLWGDGGNDRLEGGAGNDAVNGGPGDDVLTDLFGDDNIKGGEGDDAINAGGGFDLILAGAGGDFMVAGADPKETFAGGGDDFVIAGDSADTVFANEGNDWVEGGAQADLLQGDNGDPFQEGRTGDDVIVGDGGDDDYDSEGGDDIMVAGPGIERNEGMIGFDWVTHRGDPQPANADLRFTGLLPPDLDNIRDRFDNVEGLSGWSHSDVLRGDDTDAAALAGDHELTRPELVDGLSGLIGGAPRFTGGNIIIGGDGSDLIEGRGGNDLIDGDAWLNVRIGVRSAADPAVDAETVDSMRSLQSRVFSGALSPGRLHVVRRIETPAPGGHVDTAVFSEPRANYDLTPLSTTEMTVTHARGSLADGTDTLKHIERLRFADQVVVVGGPANAPAGGTVTISDTTPVENAGLTVSEALTDANGVNRSTLTFAWQAESGNGGWTTVATGATFTPGDGEVGAALRVVATFNDGDGVLESVASAPTQPVANVNDPAAGVPVLNDPTPQAGVAVTALTGGISDADGMTGVPLSFRWEQQAGSAWNAIAGATAATFTPGAPQVGNRLRVVVSFTDTNGTAESVTSAASAEVVAAAAGPAPGGGPGQGIGLGQGLPSGVLPVAPRALGTLIPAGAGPGATSAPGRISGLAVSTAGIGPITVAANVPAGANVVRIRVFRLGRTTAVRAAGARGRLVATVFRPAAAGEALPLPAHGAQAAPPVRRALPGRGPGRPQPVGPRAAVEPDDHGPRGALSTGRPRRSSGGAAGRAWPAAVHPGHRGHPRAAVERSPLAGGRSASVRPGTGPAGLRPGALRARRLRRSAADRDAGRERQHGHRPGRDLGEAAVDDLRREPVRAAERVEDALRGWRRDVRRASRRDPVLERAGVGRHDGRVSDLGERLARAHLEARVDEVGHAGGVGLDAVGQRLERARHRLHALEQRAALRAAARRERGHGLALGVAGHDVRLVREQLAPLGGPRAERHLARALPPRGDVLREALVAGERADTAHRGGAGELAPARERRQRVAADDEEQAEGVVHARDCAGYAAASARSRNPTVRRSYAAGCVRRPPVWLVSGSVQSATPGPPASRYRRDAGISAGNPPLATSRTGRGAMRGIRRTSDGEGSIPETARTVWPMSQPWARSRAPGWRTASASIGRVAPSDTTAASRRSRAAASRRTSPPSDSPKPAMRCGSTSGRRASQLRAARIAGWALSPRPFAWPWLPPLPGLSRARTP